MSESRRRLFCLLATWLCGILLTTAAHAFDEADLKDRGLTDAAISVFRPDASPKGLMKAAKQGNAEAALRLGYMYRLGQKVKRDPVKAVKWFRQAAVKGHAEAQLQMSIMYASGEGVKADYDEMRHWLEMSAGNGYALSQIQLGLIYAKGLTVSQDMAQARMWLGFAAEAPGESGEIARQLLKQMRQEAAASGLDYLGLTGWLALAEQYGKALALLEAGADRGDARSQYLMGVVFYWLGANYDPINNYYRESLRLLRKAADQDHLPAQFLLAMHYRDGLGMEGANHAEMLYWLERAAEKGYAEAQVELAGYYDYSPEQDLKLARLWYERAAKKRHAAARAWLDEQDIVETAPNARDRPVTEWDARDQFVMAMDYQRGRGVKVHPVQSLVWFKLAAEQLLTPAMRMTGLLYRNGVGVPVNPHEAFRWLSLAAEQGDGIAQAYLGEFFEDGVVVPVDAARAFQLYSAAADKGMVRGRDGQCRAWLTGMGVKKDEVKALACYEETAWAYRDAMEKMLALLQKQADD